MALGFTVKYHYAQSTHKLVYDHTNMYVKLRSDNSTVKTLGLGGGIDLRFNTGTTEYEIGTITGWNGSFNRTVDLNLTNAGAEYDDTNNKIIGSDDLNSGGATKYTYGVSHTSCPVRMIKNISTGILTFTCPCDLADCSTGNAYYAQLN